MHVPAGCKERGGCERTREIAGDDEIGGASQPDEIGRRRMMQRDLRRVVGRHPPADSIDIDPAALHMRGYAVPNENELGRVANEGHAAKLRPAP